MSRFLARGHRAARNLEDSWIYHQTRDPNLGFCFQLCHEYGDHGWGSASLGFSFLSHKVKFSKVLFIFLCVCLIWSNWFLTCLLVHMSKWLMNSILQGFSVYSYKIWYLKFKEEIYNLILGFGTNASPLDRRKISANFSLIWLWQR